MELSKRLNALIDLVPAGSIVADVGCDHGFVSIQLVQSGKCPAAIAMDVREGPLSRAREHVDQAGLNEKIDLRLSDGLAALRTGEAQTVVIAGMGGPLMQKILSDHMDTAKSFQTLILQPQSEIAAFRLFLRKNGFRITRNEIVKEEDKYYFPIVAVPDEAYLFTSFELGDMYGEDLLLEDRGLLQYLEEEHRNLTKLLQHLETISPPPIMRLGEVQKQISLNEVAMSMLSIVSKPHSIYSQLSRREDEDDQEVRKKVEELLAGLDL